MAKNGTTELSSYYFWPCTGHMWHLIFPFLVTCMLTLMLINTITLQILLLSLYIIKRFRPCRRIKNREGEGGGGGAELF